MGERRLWAAQHRAIRKMQRTLQSNVDQRAIRDTGSEIAALRAELVMVRAEALAARNEASKVRADVEELKRTRG